MRYLYVNFKSSDHLFLLYKWVNNEQLLTIHFHEFFTVFIVILFLSVLQLNSNWIIQKKPKKDEGSIAFNGTATVDSYSLDDSQDRKYIITEYDKLFLERLDKYINDNFSNVNYSVAELSKDLGMHRAVVYRKLMFITGKTPIEHIRQIRMRKGADLLTTSFLTVSEVSYKVGFNYPKRFSKYFKEEFNMTPSNFQKKHLRKQGV